MFKYNEDKSIYVTRGDYCHFPVTAVINGEATKFQSGDVVRFKVTKKKDCNTVVCQRDFLVEAETDSIEISLTGDDTRIGEVISKPTDYWYEVELNPDTNCQTIIGYDDEGAKILKLFPEGADVNAEDIEVVGKQTLQDLVDAALAQAKESGEFDGYTPQKGIDYFDGENGADGKSTYQIAVDNGYKGTEAEWLDSLKKFYKELFVNQFEPYQYGTDSEIAVDFSLAEGRDYLVIFDNARYQLTCGWVFGEGSVTNTLYIGDKHLRYSNIFNSTGEPFYITAADGIMEILVADESSQHTISISEVYTFENLLPNVGQADNGKVLSVVNGEWTPSDAASSIEVDSELSETSENPVQNKVVTAVVNEVGNAFSEIVPRLTPVVTDDDNGKFLQNVAGTWTAVDALPLMTQIAIECINYKFVPLTQEEYDALVEAGTVDSNVYYMIEG